MSPIAGGGEGTAAGVACGTHFIGCIKHHIVSAPCVC
jgi:hypothetical protein